jgi:hypothetical protein
MRHAPLLRFVSLQRLPAMSRCPGQPASGRSRCGVAAGSQGEDQIRLPLVRPFAPAVFRLAPMPRPRAIVLRDNPS